MSGSELTIGRVPGNDIVVDDLLASRKHASIRRLSNDRFEVVDLGSTNGTFVNGSRVATAQLKDGDLISVGGHVFRFAGQGIRERVDPSGPWLCAVDIGVTTKEGKTLLQGVRFALEPSRLMGIVGPSGAGKSTLLRALTGQAPADRGFVLYGGRDLCASLDLRQRMGYVPQQDLLHTQLSVREALEYAAELRFAQDVEAPARSARIDEVVAELGLGECQHRQLSQLSGGERKRTSVAAELLTQPPLLFLDEPTSGLDPGNEDQLTALLRRLADGGRTVVVATHSLVTLEQCDRVLFLARGGRVAFYGAPAEASEYFQKLGAGKTYPKVFSALNDGRGAPDLAARFQANPAARDNVEKKLAAAYTAQETHLPAPNSRPNNDRFRQWWVLFRRYVSVLKSDRMASLILLAQAPFFALLFNILYPSNVMSTGKAEEATILVWLMVVGATWIGTSNAVREVVKERDILRREHGLGLSLASYVASKVAVLGIITTAECAFLALATIGPLQRLPATDPINHVSIPGGGVFLSPILLEVVVGVVLAGLAAMGLGLLVSALARTSDQANFALPLLLVAQVVLSAPVLGSPGPVFTALGTVSTAQWGTAAVADSISLNEIRRPFLEGVEAQRAKADDDRKPDPSVSAGRDSWNHNKGAWLVNMGALLAALVATVLLAYGALVAQHQTRKVKRS
jgi:ABC-type multidrug transport system ATPase subunit